MDVVYCKITFMRKPTRVSLVDHTSCKHRRVESKSAKEDTNLRCITYSPGKILKRKW